MEWTESQDGGLHILTVKGEVDLQCSPVLRKVLRERIAEKCPKLVIDMTYVEYIDSSGLATFVEYCKDMRPYSGKLVLIGMSRRIRNVFELVRLNEILLIYDDLDEARIALSADAGVNRTDATPAA